MSATSTPPPEAAPSRAGAGNPLRLEDCPVYDLRDCAWKVQGHSRAGERTGYWLQGPNVCIDCGLSTWRTPTAVFLTHRHTDHSYELPQMISARQAARKGQEDLMGRPVLMPHEAVPMIAHLCASVAWLSDGSPPASPEAALARIGIHPLPCTAGDRILVPGLPNIAVEVLHAHHGDCSSNAYGFIELKQKLKPEYAGLPGAEIGKLRKSGVEVTQEHETPMVLIYGDTTPDALLLHDAWKKYPNIFIESTYSAFEADPVKAAKDVAARRGRGHTHLNELLPIMEEYSEGRRWFVQHTSLATPTSECVAALTRSKVADFAVIE